MTEPDESETKTMLDAGATAAGKPDSKELAAKTGPIGKAANEAPLNRNKPGLDKPTTRSR